MVEPNKQKVYFIDSTDYYDLFPNVEDPEETALDLVDGTKSAVIVDGVDLPIVVTDEFILVDNSRDYNDISKSVEDLLNLWADGKLYTASEVEKENNNVTPDEDYPMRVDIDNGSTYSVVSYYPSRRQLANVCVEIWSGSGYGVSQFYVNVPGGARNAEGALETAVALAEKEAPGLLHDVAEVEADMAEDGHFDLETGEGDAIFQETYVYVDATMAGASEPYYIYGENLGIESVDGPLAEN